LPSTWAFDATTLTVTLPDPYLVDATTDVIEIRVRAVVTDVAANVAGQTRVNTGGLSYKTKAASIGVQPTQVVIPTSPTTLTIVEPKLEMSKDDNDADGLVAAGQEVTYTLQATNTGASAHDVVMIDCVPEHLTVVAPVTPPSTPAGVVVTAASNVAGCTGTLLTWTFPPSFSLTSGASQTLTYAAMVDAPATAGQTFLNRAETTATSYPGGNPNERTTYRASATDIIRTVAPTLTKDVTPGDATVGSSLTYTVVVSLPGGLAVPDATVLDLLPAGLDFEALTGVSCTNAPAAYVCPLASAVPVLPSGGPGPTTGGTLGFFIDDLPAAPDRVDPRRSLDQLRRPEVEPDEPLRLGKSARRRRDHGVRPAHGRRPCPGHGARAHDRHRQGRELHRGDERPLRPGPRRLHWCRRRRHLPDRSQCESDDADLPRHHRQHGGLARL
jgi:fimbrial isopeptide formation D2 family protein/uncharacterized repeat protein (TIGR01451 family)